MDFGGLMRCLYDPGQLLGSWGPRKDGKTHTAMVFNQWNVEHRPEFHVLTNVPFMKVAGFEEGGRPKLVKGYPERVQLVQSFEEIFRCTGLILEKDLDCVISVAMDEFQNYAISDTGSEEMNVDMNRWSGIVRKFRQVPHALTPVQANIPKRWRHFIDDPVYGGNMTCAIFKDRSLTEAYNRRNGTSYEFKQLAWIQDMFIPQDVERDPLEGREALVIPVTSWTKPWETPADWKQLREGDCFFNHRSSANLDVGGPGFDFTLFLKVASGVLHFDVPAVINSYFDKLDKFREEQEAELDRRTSRPFIVHRLRNPQNGKPVPWDMLEYGFQTKRQTLYSEMRQKTNLGGVEHEDVQVQES